MEYSHINGINYTCAFPVMEGQNILCGKVMFLQQWRIDHLPKSLAVMSYDVRKSNPEDKPKQVRYEKSIVDLCVAFLVSKGCG